MQTKRRRAMMALGLVLGLSQVVSAARSHSAPLARSLSGLMAARHLDAVAVQDPSDGNRFIAALFYPGSELLVIAERYPAPAHLQELLQRKDYRQTYVELQGTPDPESQVFFQDLEADGLSADGGDVFYERVNQQTIFGDTWRRAHNLAERDYLDTYQRADALYASLLRLLIDALGPVAAQ